MGADDGALPLAEACGIAVAASDHRSVNFAESQLGFERGVRPLMSKGGESVQRIFHADSRCLAAS